MCARAIGRVIELLFVLVGDVLGEAAGSGAGGEDALDGAALEGAEGARVGEGGVEIGGRVSLAQEQDLTGVVAGEAALRGLEPGKEEGAFVAEVGEGSAELVEIGAATIPRLMRVARRDVDAGASWRELVTRG